MINHDRDKRKGKYCSRFFYKNIKYKEVVEIHYPMVHIDMNPCWLLVDYVVSLLKKRNKIRNER